MEGDHDDVEGTYDRMTELREEVEEVGDQSEAARRKHYEWPATRELLPDVDDRRVLDAGCGNGDYSLRLAERGAEVVGVDRSERSVAHARAQSERATEDVGVDEDAGVAGDADGAGDADADVAGEAAFCRADLRAPLPFADGSFDLVLSQLALDHLPEWEPVFAGFERVLRPGGVLVCSVGNPVFDFLDDDADVYYEVERLDLPWGGLGCHDYRRPFGAVLTPLLDAGFRLDRIEEPRPRPGFADAASGESSPHERIPRYLCLRARTE